MIFGAHRPPFDPRALARTILAQPRFRMHVQAAPRKTWWDLFTGWLSDRWNQLIDAFAHHVHLGANTGIAMGDIILALASAVVLFILVRLIAGYVREGPRAQGLPLIAPHVAAEALFASSLQAAGEGDYVRAVTLLFRASLASLDVRGVLHDEPCLTVNEFRREVRRSAPNAALPFDTLARIFTAAIYAEAPMTPVQWNAAREAYAQLTARPADAS